MRPPPIRLLVPAVLRDCEEDWAVEPRAAPLVPLNKLLITDARVAERPFLTL